MGFAKILWHPGFPQNLEALAKGSGYARRLAIALMDIWLLMLLVAWVRKRIYRNTTYDHSLDEAALILPGVVAAIVLVV